MRTRIFIHDRAEAEARVAPDLPRQAEFLLRGEKLKVLLRW